MPVWLILKKIRQPEHYNEPFTVKCKLGRTIFGTDPHLRSKEISCRSNFVRVVATRNKNNTSPNNHIIIPNSTPEIKPHSCKPDIIANIPPCKIELKTIEEPEDIYMDCVSVVECEKLKHRNVSWAYATDRMSLKKMEKLCQIVCIMMLWLLLRR